MKIKTIVMPALIVFSVIFSIWIVAPKIKSAHGRIAELKNAENKLSEIRLKNQKAGEMEQDLIENLEDQNTLMKFLPAEKKEEVIIDNLNYLVEKEGLAIFSLDIAQSSKNNAVAAMAPAFVGEEKTAEKAPGAGMRDFRVAIGIAGEYGKIKSFFEKISKLERFSRLEAIKISKTKGEEDGTAEEENPGFVLEASAVLNFNYIEKNEKTVLSADNSIFLRDTLDTDAIKDIRKKMNINMFELNFNRVDGNNPFFPAQ